MARNLFCRSHMGPPAPEAQPFDLERLLNRWIAVVFCTVWLLFFVILI